MIALLLVFALILTVLLLREKLAVGVPRLRVLRHADMKSSSLEKADQRLALALAFERRLVPVPPGFRAVSDIRR